MKLTYSDDIIIFGIGDEWTWKRISILICLKRVWIPANGGPNWEYFWHGTREYQFCQKLTNTRRIKKKFWLSLEYFFFVNFCHPSISDISSIIKLTRIYRVLTSQKYSKILENTFEYGVFLTKWYSRVPCQKYSHFGPPLGIEGGTGGSTDHSQNQRGILTSGNIFQAHVP